MNTKTTKTTKQTKSELELAAYRVAELKSELAEATRKAKALEDAAQKAKTKKKKVYVETAGAFYFTVVLPAEIEVFEDEDGSPVTNMDAATVGDEAFYKVFDGEDITVKINGIPCVGSFDWSDSDSHSLYLDKATTKLIQEDW